MGTGDLYAVVEWMPAAMWFSLRFIPGASNETYAPGIDLAHRRLTPDFTFICFWWKHELRQL